MGETHASGFADITVASVRSMDSGDRISKYIPNRFKLVLVDEAHHIVAPGYMRTLEHFGLDSLRQTSPALVGVSATFSRFDGLRLGAAIDHIVYHKDYVDMIGEKWLSDVIFTTVKSKANLSRVKSGRDGDFQVGQLSRAVNNDETNEITVKAWLAEAGNRKSTLVFCVDLKHVSSLTSMFRKHGIDAQYITGATRKSVRGDRLQAFKDRKFPVLLNCGVFTEGTDIPNIDCILLARPTKSRNLLVQMIGRGMRLHAGKENCHVIDMVASLETGIVTVPTLFGLDPSEIVKEASPNALRELKNSQLEEKNILDREAKDTVLASNAAELAESALTFTHYDSVHDLIEDTSGERHIRSLSQNAWVQVDDAKFVLAARGGVLTLQKIEPDKFTILHKYTLSPTEKSKAPWSRPREVASATTLSDAIHAADTFAATKFERIYINNSSNWRKQSASEGQLAFLNKIRFGEEPLRPDQVTKGRAGDMITKIKFGARGRFDKIMVKKRQSEREIAKIDHVENMRRREVVQVGPLER
jgi:ATP-dependent helicase IRC3